MHVSYCSIYRSMYVCIYLYVQAHIYLMCTGSFPADSCRDNDRSPPTGLSDGSPQSNILVDLHVINLSVSA